MYSTSAKRWLWLCQKPTEARDWDTKESQGVILAVITKSRSVPKPLLLRTSLPLSKPIIGFTS